MKKWLIAIGMTVCLLGLTACGQKEEPTYIANADALTEVQGNLEMIQSVVEMGAVDELVAQAEAYGMDGQVYKSACDSWANAVDDIGAVNGFGQVLSNSIELNAIGAPVKGTFEVELLGSKHDAIIEIVYEHGELTAITTNVNYSFGEKMGKAGLNTLLGMGTVFCVLILISLIISAFNLIPKVQALFAKKPAAASPVEKSVDQAIAQIVENEELSDDLELVAVISAAIAAYEGTSSDGYVVRSIRRAR